MPPSLDEEVQRARDMREQQNDFNSRVQHARAFISQSRLPYKAPYSEQYPEMPGLGFYEAPTPMQMLSMRLNSPIPADRQEGVRDVLTGTVDAVVPAGLGAAAWQMMRGKKALPPLSGQFGANLYHGSPHRFGPDIPGNRGFSMDQIGTGEGAQAFGRGIYLAEAEEVGRGYQLSTAGPRSVVRIEKGRHWDSMKGEYVNNWGVSIEDARGEWHSWADEGYDSYEDALADVLDSGLVKPNAVRTERLAKGGEDFVEFENPAGHLYKVDVPDEDLPRMLDWNKPLSEQPEKVKKLARDFGLFDEASEGGIYSASLEAGFSPEQAAKYAKEQAYSPTGAHLYRKMAAKAGSDEGAAETLKNMGIPGVRYDAGSISGWEGPPSSNYVIWDQDLLDRTKFLSRNEKVFDALHSGPSGPSYQGAKFVEPGFSGGKAANEIADDDYLWVFHSTDDQTADAFLKQGVSPEAKAVNPDVASGAVDYAPGRGAGPGLYVGGNADIVPHSRRMLAIKVRKGDLAASPESIQLGFKDIGGALNSQGAVIPSYVSPEQIVDVTDPGMYPSMKKIKQILEDL